MLINLAFAVAIAAPAPPAAAESSVAQRGVSAQEAAETITLADMRLRIGALAHDSMRGRATPSPELTKAARHIARRFEEFGLRPAAGDSYLQRFPLTVSRPGPAESQTLEVDGPGGRAIDGTAFIAFPGSRGEAAGPLDLVRPGETVAGQAGSIAVVHASRPEDLQRVFGSVPGLLGDGAGGVLVVFDMNSSLFERLRGILDREHTTQGASEQAEGPAGFVLASALPGPLAEGVASGDRSAIGRYEAALRTEPVSREESGFNTIGWIQGSDPELRDEFVVLTAHMDHLGVGAPVEGDSIYNGADDDASGTAAIIELAEAFASLETPPRRSLVFMTVSGEELGLLGSAWYADNPLFPLAATVANINIDMIGRNWQDTVVAIGRQESSLGDMLEETVREHPEVGLTLIDDPWPEENFYRRSDHYNFARNGVPILFFFTGTHEDYHGPNDEPDRILYEKTTRITRLIYHLGYRIADAAERPVWDPEHYRRVVEGGGS